MDSSISGDLLAGGGCPAAFIKDSGHFIKRQPSLFLCVWVTEGKGMVGWGGGQAGGPDWL